MHFLRALCQTACPPRLRPFWLLGEVCVCFRSGRASAQTQRICRNGGASERGADESIVRGRLRVGVCTRSAFKVRWRRHSLFQRDPVVESLEIDILSSEAPVREPCAPRRGCFSGHKGGSGSRLNVHRRSALKREKRLCFLGGFIWKRRMEGVAVRAGRGGMVSLRGMISREKYE